MNLDGLTYSDLSEIQSESTKTAIERNNHLNPLLNPFQEKFLKDGYLILEDFLSSKHIESYCKVRELLPKDTTKKDNYYGGWHYPTPFMLIDELRDMACSGALSTVLRDLIGEPMGLNLALTGWVSTQRNWHSDNYLNPKGLGSRYLAVWFALDDIHPDSGPFQMVPGSHTWPVLTRDLLFKHLTQEEQISPHWPTFTQDAVAKACEEEISRRKGEIIDFTPKKGSILIWHANLIHRGSPPKDTTLLRKSLICHYSSITTRRLIDMPLVRSHKGLGHYFELSTDGAVSP